MGSADLHIHTTTSYDGTATVVETLEYVATHTRLNLIAITDHDEIDGALEALALAPRYGVQVIPGIEVSTLEGHLLALEVERIVPPGLSLPRTLELVGEQGGYALAPHPGGNWSGSLSGPAIARALVSPELRSVLLGAEEYNASLPLLLANQPARTIVRSSGLARAGCSDAHMLWMIGMGATHFAGSTPADLRRALVERSSTVEMHPRPWYFLPSFVHRQALRSFGLAP